MAHRRSLSTVPDQASAAVLRRARWGRRVVLLGLHGLLLLGLLGTLDVRHEIVEQRSGLDSLSGEFPVVSRPGLSTSTTVTVSRVGGFSAGPRVAVRRSYFTLFSQYEVEPSPIQATAEDDRLLRTLFHQQMHQKAELPISINSAVELLNMPAGDIVLREVDAGRITLITLRETLHIGRHRGRQ